jgi:hypothetical protein
VTQTEEALFIGQVAYELARQMKPLRRRWSPAQLRDILEFAADPDRFMALLIWLDDLDQG